MNQNLTSCDFSHENLFSMWTVVFFQYHAFKNHEGGKICPFCGTKVPTWAFECNFFQNFNFLKFSTQNLTLFELHETKSDTFQSFWIKIWQVVVVFTQNQTRFKTCNSDYHTLWLFSHKICHIVNLLVQSLTGCGNPKSKLDTVKRSNQNLTRRLLFISRPGTLCTLFFKNWQVVIILIHNMTRCDFFLTKSDTL